MKKYLGIASIAIALLLSVLYIKVYMMSQDSNFEDAGLGVGTVRYTPEKSGYPIHIVDMSGFPKLEEGISKNAKGKDLVLWLGNSQLHGVNQYKQGDYNSIEYLHDSLIHNNNYTIAFSLPNANLLEHYVLLKYLTSVNNISQLIMPVFFDDTRESGLREDLIRDDIKDKVLDKFDTSQTGLAIAEAYKTANLEEGKNADMKALNATTQERVEKYLNNRMNNVSLIWASRADLRSMVIYDYLFKFRNYAFNISPNTKRRLIPLRYNLNMDAFKAICRLCNEKSIKLMVYIPPIRNDAEQPYIKVEYDGFKKELEEYKNIFGFSLNNYENIVPSKYWGLKQSTSIGENKLELDFMHFQDSGHHLLADTIYRKLNTEMK